MGPLKLDPNDLQQLNRALALAEQSIGLSDPNPRVGCVIADRQGVVVAEGFTQAAGQAHAEAQALQAARLAGHDLRGGTAWVTLEPCAHHGRTPPCCDALVEAGIARVVVALSDPFPAVNGAGMQRLRAAGITVDLLPPGHEVAVAARDLNVGFLTRVVQGRPWIRLKAAMSADARVALPNGTSQWITQDEARRDGHRWRRRAGAVVTGVGTVLADRPRMDVRAVPTTLQPLRVVLDPNWRTPPDAPILQPPGRCLVVGCVPNAAARGALESHGAETMELPQGRQGRIDPAMLLGLLAERSVNEVHLEAGPRVCSAFLQAGLVDELLLYVAPCVLGAGPTFVGFDGLVDLSGAPRWRWLAPMPIGPDLRLRACAARAA